MFDATCAACGKHHLIFESQIRGLDNTEHGAVVRYECWCGSEQLWGARGPVAA
ncbi:MAG: hypothetical protein V9G04_00610 [Nocardioides sp.]|jgi:hypothetical protein